MSIAQLVESPAAPAPADVGLRHITDGRPGITRSRRGDSFVYRAPDGSPLRDEAVLARIRSLAVPPAWTDVWISPASNGHLQATGRDQRGRKQYRYHPLWREACEESKFDRLADFAMALPRIRERVDADLAARGLPRARVLAAVVRLLELTRMRVGNEEYARANGSYGLTTLRDEHADVDASHISFHFRGKSGKEHVVDIQDRRLAGIVRRCHDLPGQELFQYLDEGGALVPVTSGDVNDYIRATAGGPFSAKDFRTWAGTVLAATALRNEDAPSSQAEAARTLKRVLSDVASALGNTVVVCRKSYVHPVVVAAYSEGRIRDIEPSPVGGLSDAEAATLTMLRNP